MRVLVDTSAWADFLNGYPSREAEALADLLGGDDEVCTCGIVVAEVFQGLRLDAGRAAIRRSFEDLTFLEPSGIRLYLRAAEVYRSLRERGRTVRSTADCIIATIAEEAGCAVLARDRDMDAILDSGLLKARHWRPAAPGRSDLVQPRDYLEEGRSQGPRSTGGAWQRESSPCGPGGPGSDRSAPYSCHRRIEPSLSTRQKSRGETIRMSP